RAAPFSADGEALDQPCQHEQGRCQRADGVVRGEEADAERRQAHHEQGDDKDVPASAFVSEVTEEQRAERPGDEADAERREGEKRAAQRSDLGEEDLVEHERRGCGEDEEDRKSTRLNSSHVKISYAVFCLKKKKRRENELGKRRAEGCCTA